MTIQASPKVMHVAKIVETFNELELSQLFRLVPTLQHRLNGNSNSDGDEKDEANDELVAYFRQLGKEQRNGKLANPDDLFMAGLTYAEFFKLSIEEQDAIWEQIFEEGAIDIEDMEEIDIMCTQLAEPYASATLPKVNQPAAILSPE